WHPLPEETNSLYALAFHSLGAERRWIHEVVGQRQIERDRAAEFRARGDDVPSLRALFDAVTRDSEEILARLVEADLDAVRPEPKPHAVRWCILHIIEHYNEHLGQMRLTRQLWENRHARVNEI
ncbi:MAG: DinB family protein, partial [Anaerolineales bacterium]|nr:DinB family protein [Anaerolineales bacterium]